MWAGKTWVSRWSDGRVGLRGRVLRWSGGSVGGGV